MISTGFNGSGATTVYVPTVSKSYYGISSIIAAQNVSTSPITVTLDVYNSAGSSVLSNYKIKNVRQGSSAYFDIAELVSGGDFSGSAKITGTGAVFVTVAELSDETGYAAMFEGGSAATTFYFPSLPCSSYSSTGYIAVQNTTGTATTLTLTYRNPNGSLVPTPTGTPSPSPTPIVLGGNKKLSFSACGGAGAGFAGTARLVSSAGNVVAVAKVKEEGRFQTAYTGITEGGCQLLFPFVRWSHNNNWGTGAFHNRTYLAIQNIGNTFTGNVDIYYLGKDGQVLTHHAIGGMTANAKESSNPTMGNPTLSEFGYYSNHIYGGSVVIQGPSGSNLIAIARVTKKTGTSPEVIVAEDYTAIASTGCNLTVPKE